MTVVIAWGTFFPLISELFTGSKASLAAPWFDRYTTPLAILLVLFTGIGPLLAWRRVSWASARRVFRIPLAVAALTLVVLLVFTDAAHKPWALALFAFAAFAIAGLAQEFWNGAGGAAQDCPAARSLGALGRGRRPQPAPLRRLHRPRRHRRAADRDRRLLELPDQPRRRPEAGRKHRRRRLRESPTCKPVRQGRQREVHLRRSWCGSRRTARPDRRLHPSRRFFRPTGGEVGSGTLTAFFAGEATSEVGLDAGPAQRLLDRAATRTSAASSNGPAEGRQGFAACVRGRPGHAAAVQSAGGADAAGARPTRACSRRRCEQIAKLQTLSAENIARAYVDEKLPATFKVIVNPLVTWIWIGGLIALAGALIALWPTRGRRRGALVRTEADALKEAKYREIRDAELDHAAGKLSDEDFAILDAELRREAVEILDRTEAAQAAKAGGRRRGRRQRRPATATARRQRPRRGETREPARAAARLRGRCTRFSASSR